MSKTPKSETGVEKEDEILLQPYTYLLQVPGKSIRSKLIEAFNYWLQIPSDKIVIIDEIIEMLHNSSLLLDDIQDNSILRRGIPVAHSIYGAASTINAANYVTFIALERILSLGHPELAHIFTEQIMELYRGQGMEIYWRDSFHCPTEEEYRQMTYRKTGGLFMLAVRLMQYFSDNKSDFMVLAQIFGLYFQVRDDYCNLRSREYSENKSYCEDLTEGKFSFPIVYAIRTHPTTYGDQIMHILKQRTKEIEVKKYCVAIIEKGGGFDYTRNVLEKLDQEARDEITKLGKNPYLWKLLDSLLSWQNE